MFPSNFEPAVAPPGKQLLNWYIPLSSEDLASSTGRQEAIDGLWSALEVMFPGIGGKILWKRVLRHAVVDGFVPVVGQAVRDRIGPRLSRIDNLFLAGDTVGVPGVGGDVAFGSALECAGLVEEYLSSR